MASLTVHDDAIDFTYLAQLEVERPLRRRDSRIDKVAAGHYAAAQFLVAKGDTSSAIDHYREALSFAPDNLGLLLNLAVLYLRQSQFTTAMDPLEHARSLAPDSPDVAKLMGWAYYGANKMDQAVAEWQRAERLRPDADVERALEKAERDKAEEESYREGETAHFVLKYNGSATPDLARGILHVLEDDFRDLESELDFTPPEPIGVILYTEEGFADITRAPSWVGALNDGRMRIPVAGPDQRDAGTRARLEARADPQLHRPENAQIARPPGCRKARRSIHGRAPHHRFRRAIAECRQPGRASPR